MQSGKLRIDLGERKAKKFEKIEFGWRLKKLTFRLEKILIGFGKDYIRLNTMAKIRCRYFRTTEIG
jgi:hypothetical protein